MFGPHMGGLAVSLTPSTLMTIMYIIHGLAKIRRG